MYAALGIVYLIAALTIVVFLIIVMVRANREDNEFITKKNLIFLIPAFLLVYFLLLTAALYEGIKIDFFYCFQLISYVVDILAFKLSTSLPMIMPLVNDYAIFYVDFVLAFIICAATVVLSIASFFSQRIKNFFNRILLLHRNCDIVVGDSPDSIKYIKNNENSLLWGTNITRRRYVDLMKDGITVYRAPLTSKTMERILSKGKRNIVVFRDNGYSYSELIEVFSAIKKRGLLNLHLEANQQEMKILKEKFIAEADKNSKLYITGFSKYELMARRFVVDYPITRFIPRSFFNENLSIKADKQINIAFIGFGKVNYQLFRMCAMQFQFAQEKNGKFYSKPVHYFVYDNRDSALHNEFFSRILYEFDEDFKDCDFPKPEKICDVSIEKIDIRSVEAKKEFRSLVSENSFTYFIISLEKDLEDASYAQTIKRLLKDNDNYRIFVRAKNLNGERLNDLNDRVIYFGEDKKLYSHDNIINDDLTELAQRINLLYNEISDAPEWLKKLRTKSSGEQKKTFDESLNDPSIKEFMLKKWSELPYIEQASNLYHALNLPFKINLLGLNMVKEKDAVRAISEEEFNERYKNSGRANGYGDYSYYFANESGNVLAFIEHSRWNALYILYDYKQMKKKELYISNGKMIHKDKDRKRHACVTTYYGLDELVRFKFNSLYPSEDIRNNDERLLELGNVYHYDYMVLDRLYSEITAMGYVLESLHQ